MTKWLKRVRAALVMGVTWAIVWAPVAVLLGTTIIDPDNSMDEMWFMVGALPGFLCGVLFSAVLGVAARRRRLDELSKVRVGGWGAVAGVMTGIIPFILGDGSGNPVWLLPTVLVGSFAFLGSLSAAGTLAIAQGAQKREQLASGANLDDVGLTESEVRELLGDTSSSR